MGKAHNKGRSFEQDVGKWLLEHDGECPLFGHMATSTARLGAQTNLGFDLVSKHYVGEAKNRKSAPKWLLEAWKQIVDLAEEHNKKALLALKKDARKYPIAHMITPSRHAELLKCERMLETEDWQEWKEKNE